ncbi:24616_t:CDS:1, partial [Dentiscutata erythropus]
ICFAEAAIVVSSFMEILDFCHFGTVFVEIQASSFRVVVSDFRLFVVSVTSFVEISGFRHLFGDIVCRDSSVILDFRPWSVSSTFF